MERRLAAILAADVVGYSRLMGEDEAGTLAALKAHRRELVDRKIGEHHGRIVKLMGDGALVEFASVVEAVECAVEIQRAMAQRNVEVLPQRRIEFRIGINLGDIINEGGDIYGDGVNLAARLEGLAESGGICISEVVYKSIRGKLDLAYDDLGEQKLKNITEPLRVYRVRIGQPTISRDFIKAEAPQLPDKPSIAVLPFKNMSGDPEQEYFSDGVTEDILTELSRYPDLMVIARNSTFVYKHEKVDWRQVARDLGVQYVLEGSVRRASEYVRISSQLIDAYTGTHLWAERYDRALHDIFAVQDEITEIIVGALGVTLEEARIKRATRKDPSSLDAYDKTLQAWAHVRRYSKEDNVKAQRLAKEAINLDPGYARAYAILAWTQLLDFTSHWVDDLDETLARSYENAREAISLDRHSFYAYQGLGMCETWLGRHEEAIANFRRAIELNPNDPDVRAYFANALVFAGFADEALEQLETAKRLNPRYPESYLQFLGRVHLTQRRYEQAEIAFARVVTVNPGWPWAHLILAATRVALGKIDGAMSEVAEARRISPTLTLKHVPKAWPFKNPDELKHVIELLHRAGLPE